MAESWLAVPDPAAWRRRASGGDEAVVAAAWMSEFTDATRGRWAAVPTGTVVAGENWILTHPSGPQVRLTWVPGAVIVCDLAASRCEQARLEGSAQEALRQGLRR